MSTKPTAAEVAAFWDWFRSHVRDIALATKHGGGFGIIHPAEVRKRAAATFGLRDVPAIWAWQKANRTRITREINQAAKPLGFRLYRGRSSYTRLERIT